MGGPCRSAQILLKSKGTISFRSKHCAHLAISISAQSAENIITQSIDGQRDCSIICYGVSEGHIPTGLIHAGRIGFFCNRDRRQHVIESDLSLIKVAGGIALCIFCLGCKCVLMRSTHHTADGVHS
ncbi:hypothetical protein SDC9_121831 [bioreactor metagenome]|uniref:Uncharacterized protein n=1 Tax=bioreactor metagenome TaxID=1076179 RepID=A0A645CD88_9ZZZZ